LCICSCNSAFSRECVSARLAAVWALPCGPAVFIAQPATRGRPTRAALAWPSVGSLVCTQARRGRAVRPARRGLREMRTRPWSTPPAPSTSSAAAAAAPPSPTCGRAPTEVRTGVSQGHSTGHLLCAPVGVPFGTPSAPLEYPSTPRVPQRTPWDTLGTRPIPPQVPRHHRSTPSTPVVPAEYSRVRSRRVPKGVLEAYSVYHHAILRSRKRHSRVTQQLLGGALARYWQGTGGLLAGYSRGTGKVLADSPWGTRGGTEVYSG
jgi:hypothetical protein